MTEPFIIEDGPQKLILHTTKWGTALSLWHGAGCISRRLTDKEMVALSKALWYAARIEARSAGTTQIGPARRARAGNAAHNQSPNA